MNIFPFKKLNSSFRSGTALRAHKVLCKEKRKQKKMERKQNKLIKEIDKLKRKRDSGSIPDGSTSRNHTGGNRSRFYGESSESSV